jgi:flagellar motor switch protein FliG
MSTDETIVVDGPRAAAEILSRLPRDARSRLVESIRTINPSCAVKIETIIIQSLSAPPSRSAAPASPTKATATQALATESHTPNSSASHALAAISDLPDVKLQEVLRDVSTRELAVSLKNAPREAKEKVLSNISSSKQHAVLDELQQLPPMKLRDVEAAQARLLKNIEDAYSDDSAEPPPPPPRRLRSRLA